MCIGNRDGGDDAVGPYIADTLKGKNVDFDVIDCGVAPENFTSVVKRLKPKKVLVVDAVDMGISPGEIRLISKDKIGVMHISTHGIPLSVLMEYISRFIDDVVLVGIQPKKMSGCMSNIVKSSADQLVSLILENNIDDIKIL